MENILIVAIIVIITVYLYRKFKTEYADGPCSSCVSEDVCGSKKLYK